MLQRAYPKCLLIYIIIILVSILCCKTYGEPNDSNSSQGEQRQRSKESEQPNRIPKKAKWVKMDAWRKNLKKGMDESEVRSLLGDPKYISRGSHVSVWYYQNMPVCMYNKTKHEIKLPKYGYVNFENTNPKMGDPRMYGNNASSDKPPLIKAEFKVGTWSEPDWASLDQNSVYEIERKEKNKRDRDQAKWQNSSQWLMLRVGMREEQARSLLGEPKIVKNDDIWRAKTWIFTDGYTYAEGGGEHGVLRFKAQRGTYILVGWTEPFWPDVDKEISKGKP